MAEEPEDKAPGPPKSKRKAIGLIVIVVLVVAAGVTGTLFGPRMLGAGGEGPSPSSSVPAEEPKEKDENFVSMKFEPLVLDVRDRDQALHHIRVGLTAELKPSVTKEEFDKLQPRGREVAIIFMRSWRFEDLTDPTQFERISGELSERMRKAMGHELVTRILVSDYVAQ